MRKIFFFGKKSDSGVEAGKRLRQVINKDRLNVSGNKTVEKIRRIKEMIGDRNIDIEVDGGISSSNAHIVCEAGANVLVAGSAIFNAPSAKEEIEKMKSCVAK